MAGFGDALDRVSTDGSDGCSFFFYNIGHNLASLCDMVRKACVQQTKLSTKKCGYCPSGLSPRHSTHCLWTRLGDYFLFHPWANWSIHIGIHKQTNACWSLPRSQTVFYHFKVCRKWELRSLCYGPLLPFHKLGFILPCISDWQPIFLKKQGIY